MRRRQQHLSLLLARRNRRLDLRERGPVPGARRAFIILAAGLGLVLALGALLFTLAYANLTTSLPSIAILPALLDTQNGLLLQPTQIYDRSGKNLLYTLENPGVPRRFLPLDPYNGNGLSQTLAQAVVAALDLSFWQNPGFDPARLGSPDPATIAERLVDQQLLYNEPAGLRRSLRRQLLAGQIIATYGRQQVLEWFLNSAYFGHLAYGADSAARLYLGKSASQLDAAEAALLAGVLSAPALNPRDAPAAAFEEQRRVLQRLLDVGQINSEQFAADSQETVALQPAPAQPVWPARAFVSLVLDDLDRRFGPTRVEQGGLKVITSLDFALQAQLTCTLRTQLARLEGKPATADVRPPDGSACDAARLLPALPENQSPLPPGLEASALLFDPASGQVQAFLGDTSAGAEDPVVTSHQPGSLLTPFVAVAAFARGMSPSTLVWDVPASAASAASLATSATAATPGSSPTPTSAASTNPDGKFHGPLRLRTALANDWLAPINGVLLQIGPSSVWQLAEPLGLRGLAGSANPSTLMQSGGGASLVELAQAYSVLANQGTLVGASNGGSGSPILPVVVLSVADNQSHVLFEQVAPETRSVLSPQLAYLVHNVLSDEPARWPSLGYPNPLEIGRPAGAKVGRAADDRQVWTAGYTRQLTAVTWIGLPPDAAPEVRLNPTAAAGLWHALVQYTERDVPPADWDQPPGISTVDVCDPSGLLPTVSCPSRVSEVFLNGNEPTGLDNLYVSVQINRETGLLATVFTPPELTEDRVYLNLPPEAQAWGRLAGLPVPPADYDRIQPPAPQPDVQIGAPALFSFVHGKISIRGTAAGANFASYRLQAGAGLNPSQWIEIGSGTAPVKSALLGQWDTAGQGGLFAVRLQVVRQNQQVETAVIQVTVDNTPPAVQVTAPQPGETFSAASSPLAFQVDASDNVGLLRVDFSLDGKAIGSASQPPYSLPWPALTPGGHTLIVTATDLAGNTTQSASVIFSIK